MRFTIEDEVEKPDDDYIRESSKQWHKIKSLYELPWMGKSLSVSFGKRVRAFSHDSVRINFSPKQKNGKTIVKEKLQSLFRPSFLFGVDDQFFSQLWEISTRPFAYLDTISKTKRRRKLLTLNSAGWFLRSSAITGTSIRACSEEQNLFRLYITWTGV